MDYSGEEVIKVAYFAFQAYIINSECMKCILNYCGGSNSLHYNFWHVIFDAWTRDIGCVARELDWKLVTSKITGLMSSVAYCFGGVFSSVYLQILVKKTFVSCMYLALVY